MNPSPTPPRREFLTTLASGLGGIACAMLAAEEGGAAAAPFLHGGRPRARRVVELFMTGGASQCDLFDYKPRLEAHHGEPFDPGGGRRVEASISTPGAVMKSPFAWARHGECGRWVSAALPCLSREVDRMAFLMAMESPSNVHGPASYLQTSGFLLPGFPSAGAWISHALGSLADDVPAYVTLPDARGLPYNGRSAFTAGFLPANHQGMPIQASAARPISHLSPPADRTDITTASRAEGLEVLRRLNALHGDARPGDDRLAARMASYELAARLQLSAPGLLDLSGETAETTKLYGIDRPETADFGRRCLLARRLLERGARFVQVWSGPGGGSLNWDNHGDIPRELGAAARGMDQPAAALLGDLARRGLLDDTLVVWTTEFGRMPFSQGSVGRDHNGGTFVSWLAGAGIRPGTAFGESDEWSWKAAHDVTTGYDLHATILWLLGVDHERLTFRHSGVDRRLTDVHGRVIREILA
jgi:hypothetical protein